MNQQKQLWDKLARENSRYYINSDYGRKITEEEFNHSGWVDFRNLILADKLIPKKEIWLEIGCGNGRMTQFSPAFFDKTIGIDISREMIKQANKKLAFFKEVENIELIETDGYTIPLEDNSIDFVFSYLVFQHFKTQEMIESNFKEVYRVLKPGGLFKIRVRTDKVDIDKWWGGLACDETYPLSIGFKLLKKETVDNYGLWLWLQK